MEPNQNHWEESETSHEMEIYGDPAIASFDAKIPRFLVWTYWILPFWGIISLYYFWNGSIGWFDRGSWKQLQIAANTTFPIENQNDAINKKIDEVEKE
ncbi:Uncharacterized protein PRO82_001547 [Candidatus Protochlamydia amoebophila]|uniref:hypothetical protein n=1 Tax=Candidatus Protochlamydia TaxID=282132 RepID=UPI0005AB2FF1|nr:MULTISPECIES: hypothetical protein [Protochlamydia]MBS4164228.1 Uncharacterized protein [Candidatus Protochlamydia amoebophila]